MRRKLFEIIKAELQKWDIGVETIGVYRAREGNEKEESAFPRTPAVMIEIGRVNWDDEFTDKHQDTERFPVIFHVFSKVTKGSDEEFLSRADIIDWLSIIFHAFGTEPEEDWAAEFLPLIRNFEEVQHEPEGNLAHDVISFSTALYDERPRALREGDKVLLSKLNVSTSIS